MKPEEDFGKLDDLQMVDELEKLTDMPEPSAIREIREAKIRHDKLIEIEDMKAAVADFLL